MKLKVFYYALYSIVMVMLLVGVIYFMNYFWHQKELPSFFYDFTSWVAYDELLPSTQTVSSSVEMVEDGYYLPQGNMVCALASGIVKQNDQKLVLFSDKGVKIIYAFHGDVKVGERVRVHDVIGSSEQPLKVSFFIHDEEVSYEMALQN